MNGVGNTNSIIEAIASPVADAPSEPTRLTDGVASVRYAAGEPTGWLTTSRLGFVGVDAEQQLPLAHRLAFADIEAGDFARQLAFDNHRFFG